MTDHLPEAAKALAIKGEAEGRDLRLDACRGLALWFIFIDHIPDNSFVWLTLRNYGFSDTTEVFVFVSGYTCMLAYGGALRELGWFTTVTRALRRGWEIYVAFLLLLITYLALIWMAGGSSRYLDETNTAVFFSNPGAALVHAELMQYTPVNTDILPTFVLLHLAFPGLLWLLTRSALVTLAASLLLYLLVQVFGWNLPPGRAANGSSIRSLGRCCSCLERGMHMRAQAGFGPSFNRVPRWCWQCFISHSVLPSS